MKRLIIITLLISVAFATSFAVPNSSYSNWAYLSTVHSETQTGMQNLINVTNTDILGNMTDCRWVEFYLNDNATQLEFTALTGISSVGTHCVYSFNATEASPSFWFGYKNGTGVGSRSNLSATLLYGIVNETGDLVGSLGTAFSDGLQFTNQGGYVQVSDATDGANYTGAFGNCTEEITISLTHPAGSTSSAVIRHGHTPAGLGGGQESSLGDTDASTTLQNPSTGVSTNITGGYYFTQVGRNASVIYARVNNSLTVATAGAGASPVGTYQQGGSIWNVMTWGVRNRTCNGTEPYLVVNGIITSGAFDSSLYANASASELSNQDFGINITYDSLINNATFINFTYNGTNYTATTQDYNDTYSTFNYTPVLTPFNVWGNATSLNYNWWFSINYTNGTTQTANVSGTQSLLWGVYTNSSLNQTNVLGGDDVRINSSANNDTVITYVLDVIYDWNGTNYTALGNYYYDFSLPDVTTDTALTYTVWNNVTYSSVSNYRNSSSDTITVSAYQFDDCSSYSTPVLNIFPYWEQNNSVYLMDLDLQIYTLDYSRQWNLTYDDNDTAYVCVTPAWFNDTVNVDMFFDLNDDLNASLREHYLRYHTLDNTTYNVSLRINDSATTFMAFPVRDFSGDAASNYILSVQRWNMTDNTYYTVTQANTTDTGTAYGNIVCDDKYKFQVINGTGSVLFTSSGRSIPCSPTTIDPDIKMTTGTSLTFWNLQAGVQYSFTTNDSLNRTVATINSISGTDVTVQLVVLKNYDALCDTTTTSSGSELRCELGDITSNSFQIVLSAYDSDGNEVILESETLDGRLFNDYGDDALFGAFMIILIVALVSLWNPILSIMATLFIVGWLMVLDILKIPQAAFVGFVALAIITIIAMVKSNE